MIREDEIVNECLAFLVIFYRGQTKEIVMGRHGKFN